MAFEMKRILGLIALGVLCCLQLVCAAAPRLRAIQGSVLGERGAFGKELLDRCELRWHNATLDHYSWATPDSGQQTFQQRYFVCERHGWKRGGPIFFYVGNEADVTLYLNATGLMWESAPKFGALLVFAEHRYYGKSKPFPADTIRDHMQYLTAEQALADYAELLTKLKAELDTRESAVIGFGGSYGGMLAAWFRMKSPNILDGAIASSAPIWSFYDLDPPYNEKSFAQVVTRDASEDGGSNPHCAGNLRKSWATLFALGKHAAGRNSIADAMRLCGGRNAVDSQDDVAALAAWAQEAFDYMAMGNFPYPSAYILNGLGELPAFPGLGARGVRQPGSGANLLASMTGVFVALKGTLTLHWLSNRYSGRGLAQPDMAGTADVPTSPVRVACDSLGGKDLAGADLLAGLAGAVGVFYNYSGTLDCLDYRQGVNNASSEDGEFWWYQSCTGQPMPFARDGVKDAFWEQPNDKEQAKRDCQAKWGVTPRNSWPAIHWLGKDISTASNIVFANGLLDPWSGGGVLEDVNDSVKAIIIPEGAHHIDLFFSHVNDPESVIKTRHKQRREMRRWIQQKRRQTSVEQSSSLSRWRFGSWRLSVWRWELQDS